MKKYILLFIFFSGSILAQAQNPPMLLTFEVNRFQNEVVVTWEIESGNLCSGVQVEHSTDSISFTSIYDYPGVCGSSTANERYTFSHTNPVSNAKNYYRINLGTNGISEILVITFVKVEEDGYTLFPMPIESNSKLYFSNDNSETLDFFVFNSSGAEVIKQEGLKTNEINLGKLVLPLGIYHFNILIGKRKIEGKFIIARK